MDIELFLIQLFYFVCWFGLFYGLKRIKNKIGLSILILMVLLHVGFLIYQTIELNSMVDKTDGGVYFAYGMLIIFFPLILLIPLSIYWLASLLSFKKKNLPNNK